MKLTPPCSQLLVCKKGNIYLICLLLHLFCAFYASSAFARSIPIWTYFTPQNSNLPNRNIQVVARGLEGTLWIGTKGGLARLDKDGQWQNYNAANTNNLLPHDNIQALALATDGSLWIGTKAGLAQLNKDGSWQPPYNKHNTNQGIPDDNIRSLAIDMDGTLWVGTGGGLARLDKSGRWESYTKEKTKGKIPDNYIQALELSLDGALWIGTNDGLARVDREGHWKTYMSNTNSGLPGDYIQKLALDVDGNLWIGTNMGLAKLDKENQWKTYSKANTDDNLPDDYISGLTIAVDGSLWIGTNAGLVRLSKDEHWESYKILNINAGIIDNYINSIVFGDDNALWIGTGNALVRLDKDGLWQTYNNGVAPDNNNIRAFALAADGVLWIGTNSGLVRLDKEGRQESYSMSNMPDNCVRALAFGVDGTLWIATNRGLVQLDKHGAWNSYNSANTNGELPGDAIQALAPSTDGTLWVGSSSGLARLDKNGHWRNYTAEANLPDNYVRTLALDKSGTLWVGTTNGLVRLDKHRGQRVYDKNNTSGKLPNNDIQVLSPDAEGQLWVGTNDGLAHLNKEGKWDIQNAVGTNGGLPGDCIQAIAFGSDRSLWVGTQAGLARFKDGHWENYNSANTDGGVPDDSIKALAPDTDGTIWIGTKVGYSHFHNPKEPPHRIISVIGDIGEIKQNVHNISVAAFDGSYRTDPWSFHYFWLQKKYTMFGATQLINESMTRSPIYSAKFDNDGTYVVSVSAIDRYGARSNSKIVNFNVTLPKGDSIKMLSISMIGGIISTGIVYLFVIFPLIPFYARFSWVRTAINSGMFTKFPFAHKAILNTRWARGHLFRELVAKRDIAFPSHYIPQSVFPAADVEMKSLMLSGGVGLLEQLFGEGRRALLVARSGTGKSIFLRYLQREIAAQFLRGEQVPVPLLIDLRTHILSGRKVLDLIREDLHGAGVELTDSDLDFLINKGGFLILVDSLNELPDPTDARQFHTFLNQDAHNFVLIASQVDLIHRQDTPILSLAEVTSTQAASYLAARVGRDVYADLPPEAQALTRNPQDLVLIGEVARTLGPTCVPTRRAELYREILNQDGALRAWVETGEPLLATIYGLAFRMVTDRRVLHDDQLREWIEATSSGLTPNAVSKVVNVIQASSLFCREIEHDILGKSRYVTGFRHELIGKFLSARYIRYVIQQGSTPPAVDYVSLSGDELWLDVFYFVIDEIDSSTTLNRFILEILGAGGFARMRITAYAIGTKRLEISNKVQGDYDKAKLNEDLAFTPAV